MTKQKIWEIRKYLAIAQISIAQISQISSAFIRKFLALSSHHIQENENSDECETCFFKVPHIGSASKQFTKSLSELVYREFGLN